MEPTRFAPWPHEEPLFWVPPVIMVLLWAYGVWWRRDAQRKRRKEQQERERLAYAATRRRLRKAAIWRDRNRRS